MTGLPTELFRDREWFLWRARAFLQVRPDLASCFQLLQTGWLFLPARERYPRARA